MEQSYSQQTVEQRNKQLLALSSWKLSGKIAFIQTNKRESASINWLYDNNTQTQQLDLTSYLGINVLHLTSENTIHTIEVDNKKYQSDNLDELITSLTGFTLPTKALVYWLKGLSYTDKDIIDYHPETNLPSHLTSEYNGQVWQVKYAKYQLVNGVKLARTFSISHSDLLIKISIKKWTI